MNSVIIAGKKIPAIAQSIHTPYQVTAPMLDAELERPGLLYTTSSGEVEFIGVGDEPESAEVVSVYEGQADFYVKQINSAGTALDVTDLFIIPAEPLEVVRASTVPTAITLSATSFNEGNSIDDTIATISVTDPDVGDTHTLTLLSEYKDGSKFEIDGTGLNIKVIADYDEQASYKIKIRAEDEQGNTIDEEFTIIVNAVNGAPTDILLSNANLQEGNKSGALVGNLAAIDPEQSLCTFSLVAGTGDADNGSFSINGKQLLADFVADYDTKNSYSARIQANDGNGGTYEKAFTISIVSTGIEQEQTGNTVTAYEKGVASSTVNEDFGYVVSVPDNFNSSQKYPVVFYIHGNGNGEDQGNLTDKVLNEHIMLWLQSNAVNAIVFAPQNPSGTTTWALDSVNEFVEWALNTSNWSDNLDHNNLNMIGFSGGAFAVRNWMDDSNNGGFDPHWRKFNTITIVGGTLTGGASPGNPRYDNTNDSGAIVWMIGSGGDVTVPVLSMEQWHTGYLTAQPTSRGARLTKYTSALHEDIQQLPFSGDGDMLQDAITSEGESTYQFNDENQTYWQWIASTPKPNNTATDITMSSTSVNDGAASGTTVGVLSNNDVDSTDSFTYSLVSGSGDTDNASFAISGANLNTAFIADYATKNSYSVRVRVDDNRGGIFDKILTISVAQTASLRGWKISLGTSGESGWYDATSDPNSPTDIYSNIPESDTTASTIGLEVYENGDSNWSGISATDVSTGDDSGVIPDTVMANAFYTLSGRARMKLTGLDNTKVYNLKIFSGLDYTGGTGLLTTIRVKPSEGDEQSFTNYDIDMNTDVIAEFVNVSPTSSEIIIEIDDQGNFGANICSIELEEFNA